MEYIDIINKDGSLTGEVEERKTVHKKGLWHHTSGLIILRKNKVGGGYEMLSQQRGFNKDKNPGLWDMSAIGHIPSGQNPLESLKREVEEELGLEINKDYHFLGRFLREEVYGPQFIENELCYIYVVEENVDIKNIKVQKEEVERVDYIPLDYFKRMLELGHAVKRKYIWDALFEYVKDLKKESKNKD